MALAVQEEADAHVPLWQQLDFVPTIQSDETIYTGKIFEGKDHLGNPTGGIEVEITEFHTPGRINRAYSVALYGFERNPQEVYVPFMKAPKSVDDALSEAASFAYLNLLE